MTESQMQWTHERDDLVKAMAELGFPREAAMVIAKMLGSPKAIARTTSYIRNVTPLTMEMIADEALAIKSDTDRWRERKAALDANKSYNEMLYYGLYVEE